MSNPLLVRAQLLMASGATALTLATAADAAAQATFTTDGSLYVSEYFGTGGAVIDFDASTPFAVTPAASPATTLTYTGERIVEGTGSFGGLDGSAVLANYWDDGAISASSPFTALLNYNFGLNTFGNWQSSVYVLLEFSVFNAGFSDTQSYTASGLNGGFSTNNVGQLAISVPQAAVDVGGLGYSLRINIGFDGTQVKSAADGFVWVLPSASGGGSFNLTSQSSAIPEVGAFASWLGAAALACVLGVRRRRR
jgi:hypothetical protein